MLTPATGWIKHVDTPATHRATALAALRASGWAETPRWPTIAFAIESVPVRHGSFGDETMARTEGWRPGPDGDADYIGRYLKYRLKLAAEPGALGVGRHAGRTGLCALTQPRRPTR